MKLSLLNCHRRLFHTITKGKLTSNFFIIFRLKLIFMIKTKSKIVILKGTHTIKSASKKGLCLKPHPSNQNAASLSLSLLKPLVTSLSPPLKPKHHKILLFFSLLLPSLSFFIQLLLSFFGGAHRK